MRLFVHVFRRCQLVLPWLSASTCMARLGSTQTTWSVFQPLKRKRQVLGWTMPSEFCVRFQTADSRQSCCVWPRQIRYLLNSIHTRLGLLRICWPANLDLDSATPRLWSDPVRLQKDVQYPLADNALRCVLLTSSSCMAGRDTVQGQRTLKFRSVHKAACGLACDICCDK